jgi:hypothetical protein
MKALEIYFAFWSLVLPMTSFLLVPSIQGTTPAYILALLAIPLATLIKSLGRKKYIKDIFLIILGFVLLNTISQLGLIFSLPNFGNLTLIDPEDDTLIFRSSMFTQSIYLLASISTFCFVKSFYRKSWNKFVFLGALLLAAYGIYEFLYFLIFRSNGDFISNRTFQSGNFLISGSSFQVMTLSFLTIMRLKSLTGEPSMYAFTILPFWIFAIHENRSFTHIILLITLILSTSTTAIIGIMTYVITQMFYLKTYYFNSKKTFVFCFVLSITFMIVANNIEFCINAFNQLFVNKLTVSDTSGTVRYGSFEANISFFCSSSIINQLFGIGFGYIRSMDMFSTLLVNNGIVGLLIFTLLFFYPIFKLKNTDKNIGLKSAIIVIYITMMISVPEYSYLIIWLFLGIAYNQLSYQNKQQITEFKVN